MKRGRIFVVILSVLFLCFGSSEVGFAQAKAKKKSTSSGGAVSTTRAKVLGDKGEVVYTVDANNPPELTAISAKKAAVEALSKTYPFGDVYSDFKFSFNNMEFKRHCGSYSKEEHFVPLEAVGNEVYFTDFRKEGPMYYITDPHTGSETLIARSGMTRYNIPFDDHVLAWKKLDDAKRFLDAVYVLKLAKEGKSCFNYLARGSKRLSANDVEGARADALAYIEENPKLGVLFNGQNALKIYDISKNGDFSAVIQSSLSEAESAANAGDAVKAFNAYIRAYAFMAKDDQRAGQVKDKLIALYPKLSEKPQLPEVCRRFRVQAESNIKEMHYRSAVSLLAELLEIAPWWPEGYYNCALLSVQTSVSKGDNLIISVPPMPKDFRSAINYMKTYILLEPGTQNARSGQDKIYEWELKAGN